MVKWILFLLHIFLLSGCFANRALNYPFRPYREIIYSFPIDPKNREAQVFELDGIHTEQKFYTGSWNPSVKNLEELTKSSKGPYQVSLCIDDDYTRERAYEVRQRGYEVDVQMVITMEGIDIEQKQHYLSAIDFYAYACDFKGWLIKTFCFPGDFDLGQKLVLSFQILKDEKDLLSSLTNPRLVFSAGKRLGK